MTIHQAQDELCRRLAQAAFPIDAPHQEALWILETHLRRSAASLLAHPDEPLSTDQRREIEALLERRLTGEPLQYVLGECWFFSRRFRIDRRAMIPRPATERLAEAVIERWWHRRPACVSLSGHRPVRQLADATERTGPTILEIGTGSGALAITLALEIPGASVVATDTSPAALDLAGENAVEHGLSGQQTTDNTLHPPRSTLHAPRSTLHALRPTPHAPRDWPLTTDHWPLTFVCADLLGPFRPGACDILVSNPPYVPSEDLKRLGPGIAHEPVLALDGGPKGLDFIRALAEGWTEVVRPGGFFVCEVGIGQAAQALALFEGFQVEVLRDYAGIERVIAAYR